MPKLLKLIEHMTKYAAGRAARERLTDKVSGKADTRRQYYRHSLKGLKVAFLKFGQTVFVLENISYGGTSLYSDNPKFLEAYQKAAQFSGALMILGRTCTVTVSVTYLQGQLVGLGFVAGQSQVDAFLDDLLSFLDGGLSLKSMSRSKVNSLFQGYNWNSYGSPPHLIESHLRFGDDGAVDEVHVAYLRNTRQEYSVFTNKSTKVTTTPSRKLSLLEKKRILRNSVLIIIGFRQVGKTTLFDHLIRSAITLIYRDP